MSTSISRRGVLLGAGVGAAGLVGGVALAPREAALVDSATAAQTTAEPTAADIGFCTDMSTHHIQALAMCQRVLGRNTGDPVQAAATEVLQTQAIEVGMMRAWLTDWGASTSEPEMVMGWMGMHDGEGMPVAMMPGLASDAEMQQLSLADGIEQGRLWIELMRAHHVGGVNMAEAALERVSQDKVRRLAQVQVHVQTYEIEQYDQLLATDYA